MDFSETQDFDNISEFIQKLMLLSQHLNNLSAKQVQNLYEVVVEDLKCKLPKKLQRSLFEMLQNIKKIDRVRLLAGQSEPDAVTIGQDNQKVYLKWTLKSKEDTKNLMEYAINHGPGSTYIFDIINGEYKIEHFQSEHGQAYEQTLEVSTPNNSQIIDLRSSVKKYDVKVLTSEVPSVMSRSQESQTRTSREERIEQVKKKLGNNKLSTEKAKKDYGEIPYVAFFDKLITDPNEKKNKKWIGFFLEGFSASWKDANLVTIREFLHEFPPDKNS